MSVNQPPNPNVATFNNEQLCDNYTHKNDQGLLCLGGNLLIGAVGCLILIRRKVD